MLLKEIKAVLQEQLPIDYKPNYLTILRDLLDLDFNSLTDDNLLISQRQVDRIFSFLQVADTTPLPVFLGKKYLYECVFYFNKDVFCPRDPTIHIIYELLKYPKNNIQMLELGVGAGTISISVAKTYDWTITAVDISMQALTCAYCNALYNGINLQKIKFLQSDLYSSVAQFKWDIIVSNPPYIAYTDCIGKEVQDPSHTLYGGGIDGLAILRKIIAKASCYLKASGVLILEHSADQVLAIKSCLRQYNFHSITRIYDFSGNIVGSSGTLC